MNPGKADTGRTAAIRNCKKQIVVCSVFGKVKCPVLSKAYCLLIPTATAPSQPSGFYEGAQTSGAFFFAGGSTGNETARQRITIRRGQVSRRKPNVKPKIDSTMKLIIWNRANSYSPTMSAQRRTIRVNRHGYIYLSGALAAEMRLGDGGRINMANDGENPKDWYQCKTQDEEGFRLQGDRHKEKTGTKRHSIAGVEFSNVCMASKLLALAKAECFLRALSRRQRAPRNRRRELL